MESFPRLSDCESLESLTTWMRLIFAYKYESKHYINDRVALLDHRGKHVRNDSDENSQC